MNDIIQKAVVDYIEQSVPPSSDDCIQDSAQDCAGAGANASTSTGYITDFDRDWTTTDDPVYVLGDTLFAELAMRYRYHRSEKNRCMQMLHEHMPQHVWEKLSDITSPDARRLVKEQTGKQRDIRWIFQIKSRNVV
jgi:hypothetical protein